MAELKDPLNNRKNKACPLPYQRSLTQEQLFVGQSVNVDLLKEFLRREGKLDKELLLTLIKMASKIFSKQFLMQVMNPI